jgi:hypothetical protein
MKTRFLHNSKMGQIHICYLQTLKLTLYIKNLMKHYQNYIFAVVIPVSHQAIIALQFCKRRLPFSSYQPARTQQLGSHLTDFHET